MRKTLQRLRPAALPPAAGGLLALLLAGCGDDRPVAGPQMRPPPAAAQAGPFGAQAGPVTPAAGTATARADGLPAPNASPAPDAAPDPMLHSDSLLGSDPLLRGDSLGGRAMPTQHSHWLRGRVRDARLTVLLNGVREGEYFGLVDRDITMKLRAGINTVTFRYAPTQADASAQMDLVESEHTPPIPPLVAFQSAPLPRDTSQLSPTTRSLTFFAR